MEKEINFVPVRKVIKIINSCETYKQLESCKNLIENYVKLIKIKGVVNSYEVRKRLFQEYNQKKFQLKMIKSFIIRYKKEFKKEKNTKLVKVA
jgi:cell fate (sporulation/competence/biofilm development) regulator YlbF (YheA/YmcA/DUF963 family)